MMHWRSIVSMCVVGILGVSAALAEPVDNPAYQQWSKFKPGSMAKWKMTMSQGGQEMNMELQTTLKTLDDAQATLAMQATMQMMGQSQAMPAQEQPIPAKIEQGEIDPLANAVNDPTVEKGQETLSVAGQSIECTWHKINVEKDGMKLNGKVWTSEKVPGQLVKMESTIEGDQANGSQKMELVDFKAAE